MLPKNWNWPGPIAIQDVAPLYHEMVDYSMEASVVVGESIYAPEANLPKVANRFRSIITKKSHNYSPQRRDTMSNIEINLRCHFKVSTVLEKEIMRMLKLCKCTRVSKFTASYAKNLRLQGRRSQKLRQTEHSTSFSFYKLSGWTFSLVYFPLAPKSEANAMQ